MTLKRIATGLVVLTAITAGAVYWMKRSPARENVLTATGDESVTVMDFSRLIPLEPPPAGWFHREFLTIDPAEFTFAVKEGTPALRVATDNSASMLFRFVDIDLAEFPLLSWRWFVEMGIDSDIDERTEEGDDHPARLFLTFMGDDGERRSMEIIWGNRHLKAGDEKFLGTFPHFTANGGDENIGRWHDEEVDLLPLYRRYFDQTGEARLIEIAIFCDSDETGTESVSYFADVRLTKLR